MPPGPNSSGPSSSDRDSSEAQSPAERRDAPSSNALLESDARRVEAELEELGDPEAAPSLPSTTLAAHSAHLTQTAELTPSSDGSDYREILRLSWPVMLSQGAIALSGLIDRAMIGRLGGAESAAVPLAAVGYATQLFFLVQSALLAVGLACVALMARAIGGGDNERARRAFAASLQVSIAVTLGFTAPMVLFSAEIFAALGATPEVATSATPYLNWVLGSAGLLAISLIYDSALRADKRMRAPMWIALVITAVKLVANWVFIFGNAGAPKLGLTGAGLATALSQVSGVLLFLAVVARSPADSPVAMRWRHLRGLAGIRNEVVRISLPGVGERVIMNVAMLSFFWVLSRYYGTLTVAAYTVGVAMLSFSWIPGIAFATSCATLVGQALGTGDVRSATLAGWRSVRLAMATAVVMGCIVAAIRYPLARVFTEDQAVIEALIPFMLALALIQPFLQAHFVLGGAHRGAGDTWTPLVAAAVGNWVFRVPLAWLFAAVLETSVVWIWFSLNLDHVARTGYLAWSFHRGKWANSLKNAEHTGK